MDLRLPRLAPLLLSLLLALPLSLLLARPARAQAGGITERDLAGIVEEQALLTRQLERLRDTMEVLLQRIEAEGRTRTAELLREGLTLLGQRADAAGGALT